MEQNKQVAKQKDRAFMRQLYDTYSSMLFGYIFEIVKDPDLAEKYMIGIVKVAADQQYHFDQAENTWCHLQQIARNELKEFVEDMGNCPNHAAPYLNRKNNFIGMMDEDQRNVFCGVYYHGKTTTALAKQLNKPEPIIRKTLKEAFAIIRNNRGH